MTEIVWLTDDRPEELLRYALPWLGERKLRLFGCACALQVWAHFDHPRARAAVELAERFADGLVEARDLDRAWDAAKAAARSARWADNDDYFGPAGLAYTLRSVARDVAHRRIERTLLSAVRGVLRAEYLVAVIEARARHRPARAHEIARKDLGRAEAAMCRWLRDIAGNPFRPAAFDPRWRTADVTGLARAIYEDRAFERLILLADALMDAGCEDADVLAHCRSAGPHVRGCWVVDLALGTA